MQCNRRNGSMVRSLSQVVWPPASLRLASQSVVRGEGSSPLLASTARERVCVLWLCCGNPDRFFPAPGRREE